MDDMFENKNSADAGNSEPGFSEKAKEDEPVSFDARQQNFDDTAEPVMSVDAQADALRSRNSRIRMYNRISREYITTALTLRPAQ